MRATWLLEPTSSGETGRLKETGADLRYQDTSNEAPQFITLLGGTGCRVAVGRACATAGKVAK